MDFGYTADQKQLFDHISNFAKRELNTGTLARDRAHCFGREEWRQCSAVGLTGLNMPRAFGGMGFDHLTTAIAMEALGLGCTDMGLVFSVATHLFAGGVPISAHATPELKRRLLPGICDGSHIAAGAITEAEAGSDAFAMKCRATREGDNYILNGTKSYVTNGPIADVFVVFASTNPEAKFLGVSAFVVERDTPGLRVGAPFEKLGLRTSPTSSLYLDNCSVPVTNLLGSEGVGAGIFRESMLWERTAEFAGYLGTMQRQLDLTVAYAKSRKQGRQQIGKYQAVAHKITDMSIRLEAARLLLYRACWLLDQGANAEKEASMAKVAISDAAIQSAIDAIQIHGGNGIIEEYEVERFLRDAVPSTITSGTSEIQRNVIGTYLGL